MRRVTFLVDGFNLYHSVREASYDNGLGGTGTKWLDIKALCASYLQVIGPDAALEEVYYFTALATHLTGTDPHKVTKHMTYIKCLQDTGVIVEFGRFKPKRGYCRRCSKTSRQYEEKETDVGIAVKLAELLFTDCCDVIVIVSGDTDIAPAVRLATRHFPQKDLFFLFPYKRKNDELGAMVKGSFRLGKDHYQKYQFSNPYTLRSGKVMTKPAAW